MKLTAVHIHGNLRWQLDLGNLEGRRRRLYFNSEAEALQELKVRQDERRRFGTLLAAWPPRMRVQVGEACETLAKHGGTLHEAVELWIAKKHASHLTQDAFCLPVRGPDMGENTDATPAPALSVNAAVEEFLRAKALSGKSLRYLQQLKCSLGNFARAAGSKLVTAVTAREIEAWLAGQGWKPETRRGYLTDVRTLFTFCQRRGYCRDNPGLGVDKARREDKPPGIHTVDQVKAILDACLESDLDLARLLAVQYFAGLRPGEAQQLVEEEILMDAKLIEVKAAKSKSRRRRLVTINETLMAWLAIGGKLPLVNQVRRFRRVRKLAGVAWSHDVMRHTFATYHLASGRNPDATAHELGHGSTQMLYAHYRELVRPAEAERFWALRPPLRSGSAEAGVSYRDSA